MHQTPLALKWTSPEPSWLIERLKDLANIVDITEHSNELAHEDFRVGLATSCPIQSTSGGSSWVARRDFDPELE
jgi:hypothetical protein